MPWRTTAAAHTGDQRRHASFAARTLNAVGPSLRAIPFTPAAPISAPPNQPARPMSWAVRATAFVVAMLVAPSLGCRGLTGLRAVKRGARSGRPLRRVGVLAARRQPVRSRLHVAGPAVLIHLLGIVGRDRLGLRRALIL